jgi:alkylation response protein AidB-like acyl-CoA dehydrogenase
MTEPKVASSDATNIESSIERDGDEYVINGRKWWTSGAQDPRTKLAIFMGKTDPTLRDIRKQQSMILVPMDAKGVRVVRPLTVFGKDDAPHGHAEVEFINVRVPAANLLLGEGRGFEIAQGRLGPGRIHHCMRTIGAAEVALELLVHRVKMRSAFGETLAHKAVIHENIAKSRTEINMCRLLTLDCAAAIDRGGAKLARQKIAMIKTAVPEMALNVMDRAIQVYGGQGVSSDTPLAALYSWHRCLRLADGPDEVHRVTIAKVEMATSKL